MKKSKFSVWGIVIGAALAVFGVVLLMVSFDLDLVSFHGNVDAYNNSGFAVFGADFYTYVNNNAALAEMGTSRTAANLVGLYHLIKLAFGAFFIAFGVMCVCYFGNHLYVPDRGSAEETKPAPDRSEAQPTAEPTPKTVVYETSTSAANKPVVQEQPAVPMPEPDVIRDYRKIGNTRCPKCGYEQPSVRKTCWECGASLKQEE